METIAAGAIALLTPYIARAAGEFAGEAGKAAWQLAEQLFRRLRTAAVGHPSASRSLDEFEQSPERSRAETQEALQGLLEGDPKLAKEVVGILDQVKSLGPAVLVTQRIKEAEDVVGLKARRLNRGSVDVQQEMDRGNRVIGAEIDEIG
jgi:hypothetical protein